MPARREAPKPARRPPPKPRAGGATAHRRGALARALVAQWPWAAAVVLVGSGGVLGLALVFPGGTIATPLNLWQSRALGWTAPLLALWITGLGVAGLWWHLRPDTLLPGWRVVGAVLTSGALLGLAGVVTLGQPDPELAARAGVGGGLVGRAFARLFADAVGEIATTLGFGAVLLGGLWLALQVPPSRVRQAVERATFAATHGCRGFARWMRARWAQPALPADDVAERRGVRHRLAERVRDRRHATRDDGLGPGHPIPAAAASELPAPTPRPPVPDDSAWRLPSVTLLELPSSPNMAPVDQRHRARVIEDTLASFNVGARVVEINEGPTVTQFGVEPGMGVTVNRITARTNDLALRLGATTLRVEAPVPGKRVVGIEVPNSAMAVVTLREILVAPEFARLQSRLGVALGRDVAGRAVAADLSRAPHLLIAGATGSGKSVCINGIIACLLMQCTPDELQLLLIDPKMVELAPFEGIPHLRLPVVTDMDKVVGVLKWALQEMERRYALFVKLGVRNLEGYNRLAAPTPPATARRAVGGDGEAARPPADGFPSADADAPAEAPPGKTDNPTGLVKPLPFLVIVIDELADLMMTAPDDVEVSLTRLAQKARATGIHLIVATQRPSVDVVTGLIKANFPTRIAFAVTSQVDSRVILDATGAEKLLGRGDMLYLAVEASKPIRVQGNYVCDAEIEALVAYWRGQGRAQYDAAEVAAVEALGAAREDGLEDLLERATDLAHEHSRISVSLVQRRLGIGHSKAARVLEALVTRGVVVPAEDGRSWIAGPDASEVAEAL